MAIIEQYQRRVLPQGQSATPRGVSAGEVIGQGLTTLGQAAGQAVFDVARAEKIQQQKNDAAWTGKERPQAVLSLNAQIKALNDPKSETYVDPTSDDYTTRVEKLVDDYSATVAKSAPSQDAAADMSNYLSALKVDYSTTAGEYQDKSQVAKRFAAIDESNRLQANILVSDPSKFDVVVAQQEELIKSQGLRPEKESQAVQNMRAEMAGFAMNGQASTNPAQFLAEAKAGRWNEYAAPQDIAQAQNIAEAEQKRRQAEAKAEATRREMKAQASVLSLADDAISSMQNNGGVMPLVNGKPMLTKAQVFAAFPDDPVRAQRVADKMDLAQQIGSASKAMESMTVPEMKATVAGLAPTDGGLFTEDQATAYKAIKEAADAKAKALSDEVQADLADSQNEAQATLTAKMPDFLQTARSTQSIPEEFHVAIAEAGYDPGKAAALRQQMDSAIQIGGLEKQADNPNVSTRELGSIYQNLTEDAKAGGQGSAQAAESAAAVHEIYTAKISAYEGDNPGTASFTYNSGVQDAWSDWQNAPEAAKPAAFRSAVQLQMQDQDRNGVSIMRKQAVPPAIALSIAQSIATLPNPQKQIQALVQYSLPNDPVMTRRVLGQITSAKSALPQGIDLVMDIADPLNNGPANPSGDLVLAEKVLSELSAPVKASSLKGTAQTALDAQMKEGIGGVLLTQAAITGDSATAFGFLEPLRAAVEKVAIVRGGGSGEASDTVVAEAMEDLTSQYKVIDDENGAAVYFPRAVENQAPDAVEAGFHAYRSDVANELRAKAAALDPVERQQVEATARDIENGSAVWMNWKDGFALVAKGVATVDGQGMTRMAPLKFISVKEAQTRGSKELAADPAYLTRSAYGDTDLPPVMGPSAGEAAALPSAAGVQGLGLTPQEQFLYQWHVNNVTGQNGGKSVKNADGSTSTVLQRSVDHNGRWYSIPSVWNGRIVESESEARKLAAEVGWDKWPSYKTLDEAEARYQQMHKFMEGDVP